MCFQELISNRNTELCQFITIHCCQTQIRLKQIIKQSKDTKLEDGVGENETKIQSGLNND